MKKLFVIGTTAFAIIAGVIVVLGFSIDGGLDQSVVEAPVTVPTEEVVVPTETAPVVVETVPVPPVETEVEEKDDDAVATTPTPTPAPAPKPTPTPTPTPAPVPTASLYTEATVAKHSSESSCWSIVDGYVYDLTAWVSQHPGGRSTILPMCGTDGSSAFHGYHGTKQNPANALAEYKLAKLGS